MSPHLVWMMMMPPPGARRVYSVDVYHSQMPCEMVGESASARSLTGSSIMMQLWTRIPLAKKLWQSETWRSMTRRPSGQGIF